MHALKQMWLALLLLSCLGCEPAQKVFHFDRPVKADVQVSVVGNDFLLTGKFPGEYRYAKAVNKSFNAKYIRLLSEWSLLKYCRMEPGKSIHMSKADIESKMEKKDGKDWVCFQYRVARENCRFEEKKK